MKKFIAFILTLALIVIFISSLNLKANAGPLHKSTFVVGLKSYIVNGQTRDMDAAVFVENNRTYVPVRFLASALGIPEVQWDQSTQTVTLTLQSDRMITVKMQIGSPVLTFTNSAGPGILAYNNTMQMDVSPLIRNSRTYLPARWLAEVFGYEVKWDEAAQAVLIGPPGNLPEPPPASSYTWATEREEREIWTSSGTKIVNFIRVNLNNPSVELRPVLSDDKIGSVEELASMAGRVGAIATINGTFFNAYDTNDLMPHGTLEANHKYYHLGSNATMGVDDQNRVTIGILTPHIEGATNGSWGWPNSWYAWGLNHPYPDGIEIFTPEYRESVTPPGRTVIVVRNGLVSEIGQGQADIPLDGYVIWYGESNGERASQFSPGKRVDYKIVFKENPRAHFKAAISNAPLLLSNGEIAVGDINEPKLTIGAPRSFVGVTGDNILIMGTVDSANVWELAEVTKSLGLKYALNLDGGASCGLYYSGEYIRQPGRLLSNCLAVIQ